MPFYIKFNQIWAIDLTFINQKPILGVIEYYSRKLLALRTLNQKSSIKILTILLKILEHYPKPKFIRTDNEIIFNSKLFKFSLWVLGIKHQITQIASPWQNGKIERFFSTLKHTTNQLEFYTKESIDKALRIFRFYYNHIKPHQNLNYFTPYEIWNNKTDFKYKNIYYFSELDNTIQGFYFIPK